MPFYQPLPHHQNISIAVKKEDGNAIVFDSEGNRSVIMISEYPCPVNDFETLVKFGFEQWQAAQKSVEQVPQK